MFGLQCTVAHSSAGATLFTKKAMNMNSPQTTGKQLEGKGQLLLASCCRESSTRVPQVGRF